MERLITAVTEPGDVVWEPFGGLCSASVAAVTLGRRAFAAETDPQFADLAAERLRRTGAAGIGGGPGITAASRSIGAAAVAR
jgi:DNA modification methylase